MCIETIGHHEVHSYVELLQKLSHGRDGTQFLSWERVYSLMDDFVHLSRGGGVGVNIQFIDAASVTLYMGQGEEITRRLP